MTIGDIIDREVMQAKIADILDLLEDAEGEVSDALKEQLMTVTDTEQLKKLLKCAAKVTSVTEFEEILKVS